MSQRLVRGSLLVLLVLLAGGNHRVAGAGAAAVSTPESHSPGTLSSASGAHFGTASLIPFQNLDPQQGQDRDGALVEVTEEQNGGLVALSVRDKVRVVIDGNPTTGFLWKADDLDGSLLRQVGEPSFKPYSQLTGGGGDFALTFEALKAGATRLRLIYHRPFEKGVPPGRVYEVLVDIQ